MVRLSLSPASGGGGGSSPRSGSASSSVDSSSVEPSKCSGATLEFDIGKSPYVFEKDYALDTKLRSGSYGVVYTTRHHITKEEYAVKVIDRSKLKEKDDKATFREIGIMKDLVDLPHVVKLIDVYVVKDFFYIVQVYAKGGDVFDRLAQRVSYTEKDARDLSIILLETMEAMHQRKISHRDMKPENLLLKDTVNDTSILVADFGFAKYTPEEGLKTRCGTPAFVAPEILVGSAYNTQVDMWSVGCLIYMLIGGYPPFQDETHRGLFRKIRAADFTFHDVYWKNVSLASKQLITSLLTVDPNDRVDAAKALESSWLEIQEDYLSVRDLSESISEMKKFKARRTLKSAVQAVTWSVGNAFRVNKLSELMQQTDKAVEDQPIEVTASGTVSDGKTVPGIPPPAPMQLNMSLTRRKPFHDIYEVREKIHRGSSAVVKVCFHREFQKEFAVKIIKRDPKTDEAVLHEVMIMNHLEHPNLVQAVDFFEEEEYFYIVMELMAGGDVFDRIIKMNHYTEKDARELAKVLLEAVDYMHKVSKLTVDKCRHSVVFIIVCCIRTNSQSMLTQNTPYL
jgi:serine/threonine protein kinase